MTPRFIFYTASLVVKRSTSERKDYAIFKKRNNISQPDVGRFDLFYNKGKQQTGQQPAKLYPGRN